MAQRPVKSVALVLVTADRGLCGAFNAGIIREAQRFLIDQTVPVELITVGRKGRDHFQRLGYTISQHFPQPSRDVRLEEVGIISKRIISDYGAAKYDQVYLAYAKFISVLKSEPTVTQLLAARPGPITPPRARRQTYQFEPDAEELLNTLLPQYVEVSDVPGARRIAGQRAGRAHGRHEGRHRQRVGHDHRPDPRVQRRPSDIDHHGAAGSGRRRRRAGEEGIVLRRR
jgi:ATP synthase F1 gamma subunit